jgi:hypothetical protein
MEQRIQILNHIFSHFQQITQWLPDNINIALEYMFKAESMIELLEVGDCGSIGGFDPKSPVNRKYGFYLYDRFIALVNRYDNKSDIKECAQFNLDSLGEYFKKLSKLRGSFFQNKMKKEVYESKWNTIPDECEYKGKIYRILNIELQGGYFTLQDLEAGKGDIQVLDNIDMDECIPVISDNLK